jgi:hypothetical protein
MASTIKNHTSGLSILKSGRRASRVETAHAAAAAAAMASMSNAGASGLRAEAPWRAVLSSPDSAITKITAENKNYKQNKKDSQVCFIM